jgi:hypothetical protein
MTRIRRPLLDDGAGYVRGQRDHRAHAAAGRWKSRSITGEPG